MLSLSDVWREIIPKLVPAAAPGPIRRHGAVYDGTGDPVPYALLELWQPDAAGAPVTFRLRNSQARRCEPLRAHHDLRSRPHPPARHGGSHPRSVARERRQTPLVVPGGASSSRFDIKLQGADKTVFIDCGR